MSVRVYADLHIHTALSPCGDSDMTPYNIANMAALKGLGMIAITDHNSAGNVEAVIEAAKGLDLTVVPGLEVETAEEVHMICLFKTLKESHKMWKIVREAMPEIPNRPDIFGEQQYLTATDEVVGVEKDMLVTASSLSVQQVKREAEALGGVCYPAHVDRSSYSILSNLGFIAPEDGFLWVEVSRRLPPEEAAQKFPQIEGYGLLTASDAHYLEDIFEPVFSLELSENTAEALIKRLRMKA